MSDRFRVVITDFISGPLDVEERILGDLADVEALGAAREEDLAGRIDSADAVMQYHVLALGRHTIARLVRCKVIVRCGVGYDNVDYRYARERGIDVVNIPDYGTEEVADSAIGLMLSLTRGIAPSNSRLRAGRAEWSYKQAAPMHRLRGRRLGIVGLGRIGTATALRAKAFGMDVVFFDPYVQDGCEKALGVHRAATLEELLVGSHVISLHCPLTEDTRRMINRQTLAKTPRGAFLVNTARGGIVDAAAVVEAIATGQLAGAGLDVLEHEPPPSDDPLVTAWRDPSHPAHDRLILNPHSAFYSEEGLVEMRTKGAAACRQALLGLPLRNVVN